MAPTPDPFFKRMMWLTFFLGISIGLWLMLVGMRFFEFFSIFFTRSSTLPYIPFGPPIQLFTPVLNGLVMPLQLILLGIIMILEWKWMGLLFQRRAFQQGETGEPASRMILGLGISCAFVGCGDFIYPIGTLLALTIYWLLVGIGGICIVIGLILDVRFLFRQRRNKREAAQQVLERQQYILQSQMIQPPRD